jgi:hypothetical protein
MKIGRNNRTSKNTISWGKISVPLEEYIPPVVFHLRVEVVFHISSSWVMIRLHTKNQLPKLPRTALIVISPGVVVF